MNRNEFAESLGYEIAFLMESFRTTDTPLDELNQNAITISCHFRTLGLVGLLEHGNHRAFLTALNRSAQTRYEYLRRASEEFDAPLLLRASHTAPLYDAIASRDFDLAVQIGKLSSTTFFATSEYEEDFLITHLLWRLADSPVSTTDLTPFIQRFDALLAGGMFTERDLLVALANSDQQQFTDAFHRFLLEHRDKIEREKNRYAQEATSLLAHREVYVEAIAYLRLAEKVGLQVDAEYPFCPQLANIPPNAPYPKLEWV